MNLTKIWDPEININAMNLIYDCIMLNTEAHIEMNDEDHRYEPCGSPLEKGMLNFLVDNGVAVQDKMIELEKTSELKFKVPFEAHRQCMTVVYKISPTKVRVIVKGAPEVIVPKVSHYLDPNNII